jgi:hypothetical protein
MGSGDDDDDGGKINKMVRKASPTREMMISYSRELAMGNSMER